MTLPFSIPCRAFVRRFSPVANQYPGLNITAKLVMLRENPVEAVETERDLSPTACSKILPDHFVRLIPRMRRRKLLEDALHTSRHVKLVDGTTAEIPSKNTRLRPRPQIRAEEKLESQISIRQARNREQIYGEIMGILSTDIKDPYLRLPVWRISRVQQSAGYQFCTIRWTIEDPEDFSLYQQKIASALSGTASTIKYLLAKRFSLRKAPIVRFEYEDYSAQKLADDLIEEESPC